MLKKTCDSLATIIHDEDIQQYAGDAFINFIQAVICNDPIAPISLAKNSAELLFHMPSVLFWDKMRSFLFGTFHSFQDQVKMTSKFDFDNSEYAKFVKRQIHLINEIDEDCKIDYFAALTRAFLLDRIQQQLYFKLAKYLVLCTSEELEYIRDNPIDFRSQNSIMVSALYQYGLLEAREGTGTYYVFSDFAKALKQNCLNFDEGIGSMPGIASYNDMNPTALPTIIPNAENMLF